MAILSILLLWTAFAVALFLTAFSDLITDRSVTVITLIAAPMAAASCGFLVRLLSRRYEPSGKQIWLVFAGYSLALILGALFLLIQDLPNMAQMGFTVFLGILAMFTTLIKLEDHYRYSDGWSASIEDWIFRGVWAVFVIMVAGALIGGELTNPVEAVSIVLLGSLTLYFTLYTVALLNNGHALSVESHWGGLGGGMGGWRLSRLMVLFILAIFFGGLTVALVMHASYASSTNAQPQASIQQKEKSNTSNKTKLPDTSTQSTDPNKPTDKKTNNKKD